MNRVPLDRALESVREAGGRMTVDRDHRVTWTKIPDPGAAITLRAWSEWLAIWYWRSPSCLRVCTTCGEVSMAGKKKARKCYVCAGDMKPVEPPIEGSRPRRKRVSIEDQE